jgi:hypothetical protein
MKPPRSAIEAGLRAVIQGRQVETGRRYYLLSTPDDAEPVLNAGTAASPVNVDGNGLALNGGADVAFPFSSADGRNADVSDKSHLTGAYPDKHSAVQGCSVQDTAAYLVAEPSFSSSHYQGAAALGNEG